MSFSLQSQHLLLPSAEWIWGKITTDMRRRRRQFVENIAHEQDFSRLMLYQAIETWLSSRGQNGRICLLKSICEAAEHPIEPVRIFDEILQLILM